MNQNIRGLLTCLLACLSTVLMAQQSYEVDTASVFSIAGTSTISDWTAETRNVKGVVVFPDNFFKTPGAELSSAKLKVGVKSIHGSRGAEMDEKIYIAFQESQYPFIVYELTSGSIGLPMPNGDMILTTKGKISMAGQTRDFPVKLTGKRLPDGKLLFMASKEVKLSDFNIEPPTAFFGSLEVADAVTVGFNLILKP